jgi:hypothetical protein
VLNNVSIILSILNTSSAGRLPGKAVNTKREHQRDRTKLSSLHGSGNVSTTIIEAKMIIYLHCTKVGTKGMEL